MGELSDEDISAIVADQLVELDLTPRNPRWKHRALGATTAQVMAESPSRRNVMLRVPVSEMRVIKDAARAEGTTVTRFIRRAVLDRLKEGGFEVDPESYLGSA